MPKSKLVKLGAWENGRFIGVIIFGVGANNNIGREYQLKTTEVCELVRIALGKHKVPVSRVVSIALGFLRKSNTGLKLVISFADPKQGHHGGIYQAGNWIYVGTTRPQREVIVNGKLMHKRVANLKFGTIKGLQKSELLWKHKYLMPLDAEMLKKIEPLRKPYPKRAGNSDSAVSGFQSEKGGANPTPALQINTKK